MGEGTAVGPEGRRWWKDSLRSTESLSAHTVRKIWLSLCPRRSPARAISIPIFKRGRRRAFPRFAARRARQNGPGPRDPGPFSGAALPASAKTYGLRMANAILRPLFFLWRAFPAPLWFLLFFVLPGLFTL